jgi:hypothetical protein
MTRDVAASVHQRLLNRARAQGRPFDQYWSPGGPWQAGQLPAAV